MYCTHLADGCTKLCQRQVVKPARKDGNPHQRIAEDRASIVKHIHGHCKQLSLNECIHNYIKGDTLVITTNDKHSLTV